MTKEERLLRQARCKRQGKLFKIIATRGLNMEKFSEKYMNSKFCLLCMDGFYSIYQAGAMNYILDELDDEFLDSVEKYQNGQIFDPDIAEWIGYIYRRIEIDTQTPSNEIYKKYPFKEMVEMYPGFHTLSVDETVEQLSR